MATSAACPHCGTAHDSAATRCSTPPDVFDVGVDGESTALEGEARALAGTAPPAPPTPELGEVRPAGNLATSLFALVPFWGPAAVWRSELHDSREKAVWSAVSVVV